MGTNRAISGSWHAAKTAGTSFGSHGRNATTPSLSVTPISLAITGRPFHHGTSRAHRRRDPAIAQAAEGEQAALGCDCRAPSLSVLECHAPSGKQLANSM